MKGKFSLSKFLAACGLRTVEEAQVDAAEAVKKGRAMTALKEREKAEVAEISLTPTDGPDRTTIIILKRFECFEVDDMDEVEEEGINEDDYFEAEAVTAVAVEQVSIKSGFVVPVRLELRAAEATLVDQADPQALAEFLQTRFREWTLVSKNEAFGGPSDAVVVKEEGEEGVRQKRVLQAKRCGIARQIVRVSRELVPVEGEEGRSRERHLLTVKVLNPTDTELVVGVGDEVAVARVEREEDPEHPERRSYGQVRAEQEEQARKEEEQREEQLEKDWLEEKRLRKRRKKKGKKGAKEKEGEERRGSLDMDALDFEPVASDESFDEENISSGEDEVLVRGDHLSLSSLSGEEEGQEGVSGEKEKEVTNGEIEVTNGEKVRSKETEGAEDSEPPPPGEEVVKEVIAEVVKDATSAAEKETNMSVDEIIVEAVVPVDGARTRSKSGDKEKTRSKSREKRRKSRSKSREKRKRSRSRERRRSRSREREDYSSGRLRERYDASSGRYKERRRRSRSRSTERNRSPSKSYSAWERARREREERARREVEEMEARARRGIGSGGGRVSPALEKAMGEGLAGRSAEEMEASMARARARQGKVFDLVARDALTTIPLATGAHVMAVVKGATTIDMVGKSGLVRNAAFRGSSGERTLQQQISVQEAMKIVRVEVVAGEARSEAVVELWVRNITDKDVFLPRGMMVASLEVDGEQRHPCTLEPLPPGVQASGQKNGTNPYENYVSRHGTAPPQSAGEAAIRLNDVANSYEAYMAAPSHHYPASQNNNYPSPPSAPAPAPAPVPGLEELQGWSVKRLKACLGSAGLHQYGLKADLVQRLHEWCAQHPARLGEVQGCTVVLPEGGSPSPNPGAGLLGAAPQFSMTPAHLAAISSVVGGAPPWEGAPPRGLTFGPDGRYYRDGVQVPVLQGSGTAAPAMAPDGRNHRRHGAGAADTSTDSCVSHATSLQQAEISEKEKATNEASEKIMKKIGEIRWLEKQELEWHGGLSVRLLEEVVVEARERKIVSLRAAELDLFAPELQGRRVMVKERWNTRRRLTVYKQVAEATVVDRQVTLEVLVENKEDQRVVISPSEGYKLIRVHVEKDINDLDYQFDIPEDDDGVEEAEEFMEKEVVDAITSTDIVLKPKTYHTEVCTAKVGLELDTAPVVVVERTKNRTMSIGMRKMILVPKVLSYLTVAGTEATVMVRLYNASKSIMRISAKTQIAGLRVQRAGAVGAEVLEVEVDRRRRVGEVVVTDRYSQLREEQPVLLSWRLGGVRKPGGCWSRNPKP